MYFKYIEIVKFVLMWGGGGEGSPDLAKLWSKREGHPVLAKYQRGPRLAGIIPTVIYHLQ